MKNVKKVVQDLREYYFSGKTKPIKFRIKQLKLLREVILGNKELIIKALWNDFRKSEYETLASEIGVCIHEINFMIKHLAKWSRPVSHKTPFIHMPSYSFTYSEPYGVCLIIGPWNYPFNLVISPLIGAIAAGNCIVIKPSELTEHSAVLLNTLFIDNFNESYISVIEGGVKTTQSLLSEQFDYIFFTGSVHVGKIVMQAAAKYLTPVTLELGGKSPCIVDRDVNIEVTAKRIIWGKFFNAGQTCIAPDYLYVHKSVKKQLLEEFKKVLTVFYGVDPQQSPDFPRIINQKNFLRLKSLLKKGDLIVGGETDKTDCYIAPTIIDNVDWKDPVMEDEIFGPILPVLTYSSINTVISDIQSRPKPLALYLFSQNKKIQKQVLQNISFGGGCINETISHFVSPYLPFGGVGASGIGSYHGKAGFDTFSHAKSIMKKPYFPDLIVRYPPYTKNKLRLLKKIFKIK